MPEIAQEILLAGVREVMFKVLELGEGGFGSAPGVQAPARRLGSRPRWAPVASGYCDRPWQVADLGELRNRRDGAARGGKLLFQTSR
jgi:hypothetical protein